MEAMIGPFMLSNDMLVVSVATYTTAGGAITYSSNTPYTQVVGFTANDFMVENYVYPFDANTTNPFSIDFTATGANNMTGAYVLSAVILSDQQFNVFPPNATLSVEYLGPG